MHSDLIFDIGMHDGTDTAFYLRKGFRVVAVEANPDLVEAARRKFAEEIAAERLIVHNQALTSDCGTELTLYVADDRTDVSSLSPDFVRAQRSKSIRPIKVPGVALDDLIARHGTPYYVKIDVEGHDNVCLPALLRAAGKPRYFSCEADIQNLENCAGAFEILVKAGYRRFKVVNQLMNRKIELPNPAREGRYIEHRFGGYTSGPFGEESPGEWTDERSAMKRCQDVKWMTETFGADGRFGGTLIAHYYAKYRYLVHRDPPGWYDIHAALP